MASEHSYEVTVTWTGNTGGGTVAYRDYSREHLVEVEGKPALRASADPAFLGDAALHNPEDLLVAALSECHMLWYLGLCANSGVVVTAYRDEARGTMAEVAATGGHFTEVVLRPTVTVAEAGMLAKAEELHARAHSRCYIANSVNFPVRHEPEVLVG
ncbi:OsmC family protein [Saccharopolyspora griseoalba]|uniref:OsmC family protein n=1 Tax=Saccharopolyspora griseoalba TaxID=1431848 RepID=A0ABW2LG89_9PSEU